jgi:hypothetical protein
MRLHGKSALVTGGSSASSQRGVGSPPRESSVPAEHTYSKCLIKDDAIDKTAGGFDAETFAQHFNEFRPDCGHFRNIYRHMRGHCQISTGRTGRSYRLLKETSAASHTRIDPALHRRLKGENENVEGDKSQKRYAASGP